MSALWLWPVTARADSPFEGKWTQGPIKEDYHIIQWDKGCEAQPVSGSSGGGEQINIHAEGDELTFIGGGRVFKTNQCYDLMPSLTRESHTRNPSGREWRTRCTTPPNDPRYAAINTVVAATSDTQIEIVETGRYMGTVNKSNCIVDVKRSRFFDLIAPANPAPTVAPAPPPSQPPSPPKSEAPPVEANRCASPGDPSRLEARPSRKLLRTGESFSFHALVLDGSGCVTSTPTTWTVDDKASKALKVDGSGKVTVADDATEGTFDLVVTAAGKSTRVTVEVTSPGKYDSLLQQSGLNDAGENDAASVAVIAGAQLGGLDAVAEDSSKRRRTIFLSIISLLAVALGGVALVASRRSKRALALEREAQERYSEKLEAAEVRKRAKAAEHAAAMKAHEESVEKARQAEKEAAAAASRMVCPACRREYDSGSAFCPNDASRLVPFTAAPLAAPPASGSICPTCKRGYDAGVKVCPQDKDELIPYALYASRVQTQAPTATKGKICPTCGGRFEGIVEFCGKDGTALVLLN